MTIKKAREFDRILEKDVKRLALMEEEENVRKYELPVLKKSNHDDYSKTKEKFGALAVTDAERQARSQRDRRFSLSPMVRKTLSVEEEENRVIEERLKDRITALAEEVKAQAYREGLANGMTEGFEKAYREFQDEGSERLKHFDSLLKDAEAAKLNIYKANERFLIELIYRIARLVIHKDLERDNEFLNRLVVNLLNRINVKENVTIRIHPNDAQTMAKLRKTVETEMEGMKNLKIEISQKVRTGGCIIETDWNIVDASLDTQLEGVYTALLNQTAPKLSEDDDTGGDSDDEGGPMGDAPAGSGPAAASGKKPSSQGGAS